MNFYCGKRIRLSGHQSVWVVDEYGKLIKRLTPQASQKLVNHSPDGFNWGYGGSGPAQLALAILLDVTNNPEEAMRYSTWFKDDYVAQWGDQWSISEQAVKDWLTRQKGGVTVFSEN